MHKFYRGKYFSLLQKLMFHLNKNLFNFSILFKSEKLHFFILKEKGAVLLVYNSKIGPLNYETKQQKFNAENMFIFSYSSRCCNNEQHKQ